MVQSTTLRPSRSSPGAQSRQRHAERTTPPPRSNRRHPHRAPGRHHYHACGGMFGRKKGGLRGTKTVRLRHPVGDAASRIPGGRVHRRRIPTEETRGRGRAAGGVRQPVWIEVLARVQHTPDSRDTVRARRRTAPSRRRVMGVHVSEPRFLAIPQPRGPAARRAHRGQGRRTSRPGRLPSRSTRRSLSSRKLRS